MNIFINKLKPFLENIKQLCQQYAVERLFVLVLTERFNESSNIDFVVKFEAMDLKDYADSYSDFQDALHRLLHREIDLLEEQAIKNPILKTNIEHTKQLIYARREDREMAA